MRRDLRSYVFSPIPTCNNLHVTSYLFGSPIQSFNRCRGLFPACKGLTRTALRGPGLEEYVELANVFARLPCRVIWKVSAHDLLTGNRFEDIPFAANTKVSPLHMSLFLTSACRRLILTTADIYELLYSKDDDGSSYRKQAGSSDFLLQTFQAVTSGMSTQSPQ